ncbi:SIS domain-containing protein [Candidatus Micrarchaeota archaeon]|nr:SIS domain-containing protein [Candidatus Micrarchaeota archaeon]
MELFDTEKDMLETPQIIRDFDWNSTKEIARKCKNKTTFITGLGSSYMFPVCNARRRALRYGVSNVITGWSTDLMDVKDFSGSVVLIASFSGRTKEAVLLARHAKSSGARIVGVTAVMDSFLAKESDDIIKLNCDHERGVAATKSAVETALVFDSFVSNMADIKIGNRLPKLADCFESNLNMGVDNKVAKSVAGANRVILAGSDFGVGNELSLKVQEATAIKSQFLPGNLLIHGYEETVSADDVVLIIDSPAMRRDLSDYYRKLPKTGCTTFLLTSEKPEYFPAISFQSQDGFAGYCQLSAGWGLLRHAARAKGVDMDHPKRAVKVGNPLRE